MLLNRVIEHAKAQHYRSFFTGARIASIRQLLDRHCQIAGLIDALQAELEGAR